MRDLVGDGDGLSTFAKHRSISLVEQQRCFAVEDGGGVLHPTPFVIRDRNHIELAERILDSVPLVVKVDAMRGHVHSKCTILFPLWNGAYPDRNAVDYFRQALPVPDRERNQICRHLWRGGERNAVTLRAGRYICPDAAI